MKLTEEFLHGERVYDGKLLKVHRDVVRLPSGKEEIREVIRHPGAAVVVPHLGGGRFVLVRQFRYALNRETLEFPAGRLDASESPLRCAKRELAEETGYLSKRWKRLFTLHPAPGYTDEILHIFLAESLQPGASHPDDDENLLIVEATLEQLLNKLRKGQITDSKTSAAILFLKATKWR
jgi:ADP-ribose pyrophosphatase